MTQEHEHHPTSARHPWPSARARWWMRRTHMVAGFWQKSVGWTLPRDERGEGYWQLARHNTAQIGFCMLFIFASAWGQTFLLSVFQPHWMRALHLNPGEMGLIYGGATLASGLLLPWTGRWLDRAKPGVTGMVTCLGLAVFSLLAAAVTNAAMLAVALFGLRFFGQGLSTNVGTVNAARWFHHNRGKAVSLASLGFPLGEATLPMLITFSALTLGWRPTWYGLAAVCVLVFIPMAHLLAARHPQAEPNASGDEPDEDEAEANGATEDRRAGVLHDWRFYAMLGMIAPLPFVSTGIIFFQATLAEGRGWSGTVFATGFVVFGVVRAACTLSAGAWVDRLGAVRMLPLPAFAATAGLVCLVRPEPAFAYFFFAGLGLAFGSSGAITTTAWTEMFGVEKIGTIRAMSSSFAIFLTAAAPACFGLILNSGVSAEAVISGCALLMLGLPWPLSIAVRRQHRPA